MSNSVLSENLKAVLNADLGTWNRCPREIDDRVVKDSLGLCPNKRSGRKGISVLARRNNVQRPKKKRARNVLRTREF